VVVVAELGVEIDERLAEARRLLDEGLVDRALSIWEELTQRCGSAAEPELRAKAAVIARDRVWWLLELRRVDQAVAAAEEMLACFRRESDVEVAAHMAGLLQWVVNSLLFHNRVEDKRKEVRIRVLAQLVGPICNLLGDHAIRGRPGRIVSAERRRNAQALRISTALIERFRDASDAELVQIRAGAQFDLGLAQFSLGRPIRAVLTVWQVVSGGGTPAIAALADRAKVAERSDGPDPQRAAAGALMARAMAIEAIDQPDETQAAYVEFVERFKNHPNPMMRLQVRLARGFRRRAQPPARLRQKRGTP
jgi:hypothetical protein